MHIEQQIGGGHPYIGTLTLALRPPVSDRILDAVGDVLGVTKLLAIDRRIDGKTRLQRHILRPIHLFHLLIDSVGILGLETKDRHQHARGGSEIQIRLVHQRQIAREGHRTALFLDIVGTEPNQLLSQYIFQTFEGLGYHREFFHPLNFQFNIVTSTCG